MWLARRGSLIGLLLWPGTLFYVLYGYAFYLIGVPFNALFLLYVALVTVSTYTMIGLLASIDGEVVRQRLSAVMPRRTVGGALVGLAILYFALETLLIVATLASRALLDPLMHTAWIIDLTVQCRALLVGGVLLWRRETLGYVVGAGLLLQFGVLNVGYLVVVVLQAFFAAAPINAPVVALLLVTGVICFTPLTFFVRGGARR